MVYMLHMENKNMKSYAIIIKLANTINELKPVAWVGLKPTSHKELNHFHRSSIPSFSIRVYTAEQRVSFPTISIHICIH